MTEVEPPPFRRWATVFKSNRYIAIASLSGYRRTVPDPDALRLFLDPDASNTALGDGLLQALARSRFLVPPSPLYGPDEIDRNYAAWCEELVSRYGYSSKRRALENALNCFIWQEGDEITIEPMRRGRADWWHAIEGEPNVVIPTGAGPEEAGAALRHALSRCRPRHWRPSQETSPP